MKRMAGFICAALLLPVSARAEGKCGDAPFRLADGRLVVTWTLPVPAGATVTQVVPRQFPALDESAFRSDVAAFDAGRYASPAKAALITGRPGGLSVELMPTSDIREYERFNRQFEIPPEQRPEEVIRDYFGDGYRMYASVVEHPQVPEGERGSFNRCSCTVQRAVLVHDGKTERMFVRTTFLSAKDDRSSPMTFAPAGGLLVTFPRAKAWFPQRFNEMVLEARTLVSLDVLTPREVALDRVPAPFRASRGTPVQFENRTWQVLHVTADLEAGKPTPADLEFSLDPTPLARR
ncbi:MAG TPA: hypothetical protein VFR85_06090 [Anaeromyxobacteraceae bacterium]|nr:hypothetical protein [Anaeromyxobacteraceae bacterium]